MVVEVVVVVVMRNRVEGAVGGGNGEDRGYVGSEGREEGGGVGGGG